MKKIYLSAAILAIWICFGGLPLVYWQESQVDIVAAGQLYAADQNDWLSQREAEFSRWRDAHTNLAAEVAKLKSSTSNLVKSSPAASSTPDAKDIDESPIIWRIPGGPTEIWDAAFAPRMVVIPAGEYTMGSPTDDPHRGPWENSRHRVRIDYAFAVGKFHVTRGEFAQFVAETQYDAKEGECTGAPSNSSWEDPGFEQSDDDPVVCINYQDAQAYIAWLSEKTGQQYRLLSEAEWEYAARAGTTTAYYWGDTPGTGNANCDGCGNQWDNRRTSPVGSFAPNAFGLYDMTGNAWQLVDDCWNDNYDGAPVDGSSWRSGDCTKHPRRGASYHSHLSLSGADASKVAGNASVSYVRVPMRVDRDESTRFNSQGFRVARTL